MKPAYPNLTNKVSYKTTKLGEIEITKDNLKRLNDYVDIVLQKACFACPDKQVKINNRKKILNKNEGLLKYY